MADGLADRSKAILEQVVERYIEEGSPVGSKTVADHSTVKLSAASIRHIMSDLEQSGYLLSPHTSAGRIPTNKGYRVFVDGLLTLAMPRDKQVQEHSLKLLSVAEYDKQRLVQGASTLLSELTGLVGIVMLPKSSSLILRHVEFLLLSKKRVLVILVLNEHDVQNRVIHTEHEYNASDLEYIGNYLTAQCGGRDLLTIRENLLHELEDDRKNLDSMVDRVMEFAKSVVAEQEAYVVSGENNLFASVDQSNYDQLRELFKAFEQKRSVLSMLDACLRAEDIQIFIGEESGQAVFNTYSVVTAPYSIDDKKVGVLGVIGPTRMPYRRVISAVGTTAQMLENALT